MFLAIVDCVELICSAEKTKSIYKYIFVTIVKILLYVHNMYFCSYVYIFDYLIVYHSKTVNKRCTFNSVKDKSEYATCRR